MGIDPGTNFMGYAILKTTGKNCKPELVECTSAGNQQLSVAIGQGAGGDDA